MYSCFWRWRRSGIWDGVLQALQRQVRQAQGRTAYGVETKQFNEQVKRNRARFPDDFMFQMTEDEFAALMSQNATSNTRANA